jgi:CHRD domain
MQTQSKDYKTVSQHDTFNVRFVTAMACVTMCLIMVASAIAADPEVFKARLSPLGVTNATVNTTTGVGSVTATLNGSQLTIDGSFEGLTGLATSANIRRGPKGIPGPVIFDISIAKATSGKINATLALSAEQIADLRAGRLYLQIHSERAPEGSIRGWMLGK